MKRRLAALMAVAAAPSTHSRDAGSTRLISVCFSTLFTRMVM